MILSSGVRLQSLGRNGNTASPDFQINEARIASTTIVNLQLMLGPYLEDTTGVQVSIKTGFSRIHYHILIGFQQVPYKPGLISTMEVYLEFFSVNKDCL